MKKSQLHTILCFRVSYSHCVHVLCWQSERLLWPCGLALQVGGRIPHEFGRLSPWAVSFPLQLMTSEDVPFLAVVVSFVVETGFVWILVVACPHDADVVMSIVGLHLHRWLDQCSSLGCFGDGDRSCEWSCRLANFDLGEWLCCWFKALFLWK